MPVSRKLPSHQRLHELFNYDPASGELRWKFRSDKRPQWNGRFAGELAGGISKSNGHMVLNIEARLVLAHRVIWKMVYGDDAPSDIDHRDGDPTNNRINNLRLATKHENLRNSKRHRGKALPKGVSPDGNGRYRASIFIARRCRHLGSFDDPEAAHAAYKVAAAAAFGEFARFE